MTGQYLSLIHISAPSGEPIRIGFEGWSSGADAYMGQVAEAILQDYIDDVNANGGWLGRPVELVAYDISKDFSESINATNRLINQDKVVAIIGPDGSPFAIPLGDIVAEAKVPLLPYGSNSLVTVNEDGSVKPYAVSYTHLHRLCGQYGEQYGQPSTF